MRPFGSPKHLVFALLLAGVPALGCAPAVKQSPPPPVAATPLHELFPNAHHEKPSKGDKKRAEKLCAVVGGCVRAGKVDASRVKFTSAFFWIVEDHEGRPIWAHLNGVGELDLLPIEAPGLVADNEAGIVINSTTTLCMAESDYRRYRSLVNKARKALNV